MKFKIIKHNLISALLLLNVGCSDIYFLKTKRFTVKEPHGVFRVSSDLMCVVKCVHLTGCQGAIFSNNTCVIGEILPVRTNSIQVHQKNIWIQKSVINRYDKDGYLKKASETSTVKTTIGTTSLQEVPKQAVNCPRNYVYLEDASGCFMVTTITYTYDLAVNHCGKDKGSRLAALTDEKKRKAVKAYMDSEKLTQAIGTYMRVGGRQRGDSLEFLWEDGQVWSWGDPTPWCSYYHPATPLDCACFYLPGDCIMSASCKAYQAFVCEIPV